MGPGVKATLRGLALCALVPAVVAAVVSPVLGLSAFLAAFALALFVGFPILVILEQHVVTKAWMACLGGFLLGIATAMLMFWPQTDTAVVPSMSRARDWSGFVLVWAVFGIAGAPAGWVLWYNVSKHVSRERKQSDGNAKVA